VFLVLLSWPCHAADAKLNALRSSLVAMRGNAQTAGMLRGATPQLTVVKHQLRDWAESRLVTLKARDDEGALQRQLNAELRAAGLSCSYKTQPGPDWTCVGYLEDLTLRQSGGFLVLQTGVGIDCGSDESAYLYAPSSEGWKRAWQTEQNTYTEKDYRPQTIRAVHISPFNRSNDYVLLTLGSASWCSSNWHSVYYRAFRLGPDPEAPPLVNGDEIAYLANDPPIQGSVTADDVLVEFTIRSIDSGVHNREAIRHYAIDHGKVERVDPLALSPRDFVDEWLTHDWREAASWSENDSRRSMADRHKELHKDFVAGGFFAPTTHCTGKPDLWEVGIDFSDPPTPWDQKPKGTYFLVRWQPPYIFRMVQVTDKPTSTCTEVDRAADEHRTLFPVQDWR
jgi:hypothetical protein